MENKVMTYPFPFAELRITDGILDKLGFTEYWGGPGDFGDRRLDLGGQVGDERLTSKNEYPLYLLYEIDETEDPECGYGYGDPMYCSQHFSNKSFEPMYFLHEMYEDILARRTLEEVENFIDLTKKRGVNMYPYIQSYLKWKNGE